jgi:hypothetical protein
MTNKVRLYLVLGYVLLGTLWNVDIAFAYTYTTCNATGNVRKWYQNTIMYRNSLMTGDAQTAYQQSGEVHWKNITTIVNFGYWIQHDTISLVDTYNETAIVDPSAVPPGAVAITYWLADQTTCHLIETDVWLRSDTTFAAQDESFYQYYGAWQPQGRAIMVHEHGHVLGLNDNNPNTFTTLKFAAPWPLTGGNTAEPYPDDASGVRFFYGGSGTNVFSSAQRFYNGDVQATGSSAVITKCKGNTFSVIVTVGNNGTTNVSSTALRVYASTSAYSDSGYNMWTGNVNSLYAGTTYTTTLTVTVPTNIPNGTYYILWKIDNGKQISEFNENDNRVHSSDRLKINC